VRWAESGDALVSLEAKANFRVLGKRFGKATPLAAAAVQALDADALRAFERGADVAIMVEGSEHMLQPEDLTILPRASGAYAVQEEDGFVVASTRASATSCVGRAWLANSSAGYSVCARRPGSA
jgi:isoleucyl-tRNA synthetase